ncbi:MAG: hypothetical protein HYZ91_06350 [Candidatus Omnitrophica bacterium]|nr:hypothetical protein [Candidatus Omnitrophota bacterium]
MAGRRFLLLHITTSSGHHRASCAIERTLKHLDPSATVVNIDALQYASRPVRWAISRTYSSLIRHQPDVWEYLYDNPAVHRRIHYFQALLHRYHATKLHRLLESVRPDAIACTQAYPCGIVADFKRRHHLPIPLVGVLTDYAPHLYWFHDTVDAYVVPSEQVKRRFMTKGVNLDRVKVFGIPIDLRFLEPVNRAAVASAFGLDLSQPILLLMGGGGGFGQLRDIVLNLDTLPYPCQMVVVAGTNRLLLAWLQSQRFRHRVLPLGYTQEIHHLMSLATLLISKPGGLTTSESLAKHLPLVVVNPIPGQEAYNARYLLSQGAAVQAGSPETVRQTVRDLLENPDHLESLRRRNAELAHPSAALETARLLMELADAYAKRNAPERVRADGDDDAGSSASATSAQRSVESRGA